MLYLQGHLQEANGSTLLQKNHWMKVMLIAGLPTIQIANFVEKRFVIKWVPRTNYRKDYYVLQLYYRATLNFSGKIHSGWIQDRLIQNIGLNSEQSYQVLPRIWHHVPCCRQWVLSALGAWGWLPAWSLGCIHTLLRFELWGSFMCSALTQH